MPSCFRNSWTAENPAHRRERVLQMTGDFSELTDALRERLSIVSDHDLRARDPKGHLDQLKSAASRLDAAIAQLPPCDPELRHYLNRQSYVKALAWLEEQDAWLDRRSRHTAKPLVRGPLLSPCQARGLPIGVLQDESCLLPADLAGFG